MQDLDFIERPAEGDEATMCKRCGAVKPNAQFKRTLSPMQAHARGYANNKPVWYVSRICHACKPYKKPAIQNMGKRAIKNLHAIGAVAKLTMDAELDRRKSRVSTRGQATATKRWAQVRKGAWQPLMQELADEIVHIKQQHRHVKRTMPEVDDHEFFDIYLHYLLSMRADFKHKRSRAEPLTYARWVDYIPHEVFEDLMSRWQGFVGNTPMAYTNRVRLPAFAQIMDTRNKTPAPTVTLVDNATKERLNQIT